MEFYSRIINKHDTEANWNNNSSFVPAQGELIVYDIDNNYNFQRIKMGDGITAVANLPFINIADERFDAIMEELEEIKGLAATGGSLQEISATPEDVLTGKTYNDGEGVVNVGTMVNNGAVSQSLAINGSYIIPAGYHNGSGKITQNITTKAAATYGAKTSAQTISAGQYLSGAQTIAAVTQSGLSAANIVKGKTVTIKSNGSNLWSVTGTSPGNFDFTTLGTPTYTHSSNVALSYKHAIVSQHMASVVGINGSSWGGGYYTFPNAIDVKNYTTMTVYSIVNRANVYSGGDTTYISINDVSVKTTAQLQSMVHTIDVSNVNTVKLKVDLGWHAGNYGGINIYDIQFS